MPESFIRKLLAILIFLSVFAPSCIAHAEDTASSMIIFPGKKVFPLFTADGLSHQLSLSRVTENKDWIGAVGGSIPIVQLNLQNLTLQGGVAVTVFSRLVKTPGHLTVYTIDYKVDFPIDIRFSELALRAAVGHISCHFADDAIELLGKKSIQHVNDYITLAAAYDVTLIQGYVYAGFNYSYGTQPIPHKPWLLQVGTSFGNIALHDEVSLYGAIDLKIKEEIEWGSIRSFQLGVRLFPRLNYGVRIAYTFRTGFEDRGQFYMNKTTLNLVSAFIDF
ncbi:MAG: DUF1207 domain-containing protein [Ignavibacteriae bacterium]|nr:DUF1207 domain-containing protein [Ignavibacteriota bacterium]